MISMAMFAEGELPSYQSSRPSTDEFLFFSVVFALAEISSPLANL